MWKKEMCCDEFMLFICFVVIFYVTIYLNLSDILDPQWNGSKVVHVYVHINVDISFLDMIDLDDVVPSFYSLIVLSPSGNSWKLWDKDDKTVLFFVDFWRNNKIGQTIVLKVS